MKVIKGFKLANVVLASAMALALVGCGDDPTSGSAAPDAPAASTTTTTTTTTTATTTLPAEKAGVIFGELLGADWSTYDCCGDLTATPVLETTGRGTVMEFVSDIQENALGFKSTKAFDASAMAATGTLEFGLKVVEFPETASTDWVLKVESNGGSDAEGATGQNAEITLEMPTAGVWKDFSFTLAELEGQGLDLTAIDKVMVFPVWGSAAGAVYRMDQVRFLDKGVADTEAPVITLLGSDVINHLTGTPYKDQGVTVLDNLDTGLNVTVGGDTVNASQDGTYYVTYNVTDAAGNAAAEVTRTVIVSASDLVAPVIKLLGGNTISLSLNADYVEPGFTAIDNVDGDVSLNVVVAGSDTVNTSVVGTYNVTYNVTDAALNKAAEVTRTVAVSDPSLSIINNGDFETTLGAEWELQEGVGSLTIVAGELVVEGISPGAAYQPRLVQGDVVLVEGVTYKLRFDASVAEARSIQVQVGELLAGAPWYMPFTDDQTVALTTTMDTHELVFTANANAAQSGDLIFALGAGVSTTVTLDNISITEITAAEIPPAINLLGDNPMTIFVGDTYADPGFTATDNVDGDVAADVIVSGTVDDTTVGDYVVTYNVMDNDGNMAAEVTRTVNVNAAIVDPATAALTPTATDLTGAFVFFSDAQAPDVAVTTWAAGWWGDFVYSEVIIAGDNAKRYTVAAHGDAAGVEFPAVDLSGKTTLHLDWYVEDLTSIAIQVMTATNGGNVREVMTPVTGEWVHVALNLNDMVGNMVYSDVQKFGFTFYNTAGTTPASRVYIDNVYFK